jgi:hypothetical protein
MGNESANEGKGIQLDMSISFFDIVFIKSARFGALLQKP